MTLPRWLAPLPLVACVAAAGTAPLTLVAPALDPVAAGSGTATVTNVSSAPLDLLGVDTLGAVALPAPPAPGRLAPGARFVFPFTWSAATVIRPALVVRGTAGTWVLDLAPGGAVTAARGASPLDDPAFTAAAAAAYERECCSTAPPPVVELPPVPAITTQAIPLRYCYSRELRKDHALAGELQLGVSIGPDGRVTALHLDATTLPHGQVEACVAGLVAGLHLPAPTTQGAQSVTYRFAFRPGG